MRVERFVDQPEPGEQVFALLFGQAGERVLELLHRIVLQRLQALFGHPQVDVALTVGIAALEVAAVDQLTDGDRGRANGGSAMAGETGQGAIARVGPGEEAQRLPLGRT